MNPVRLRRALVAILTAYGIVCLRDPSDYRVIDALDLAIHETGHLLFTPFGELMHVLGGSLFQLLVPAAFMASFARRGDRFAVSIVAWWLAQNCWNISVYVADARAQALPLVGGGEHDWWYLLGRAGWLERDLQLSRFIHLVGVAIFGVAMVMAWQHAALRTSRTAAGAS